LDKTSDYILSASADRTVKLWDLRNSSEALASVKLSHGVEDFCRLPTGEIVVANGPVMSLLNVSEDMASFKRVADYTAFQKPVMRVRWDAHRERLMAGGQDAQMKLFAMEEGVLKVAYKIKLPHELSCLDVSPDGQHFAVGMSNGGLVIKSKAPEAEEGAEISQE
jgi:WD40 repeat protein